MTMQNPPSPAGENAARAALKPAGALKRDINLLPANETSERIARRGTIALAVLVGALLLGYFAIVMPSLQLKDLQNKADDKANEASSLQGADADFNRLVERRNALNQMIQSIGTQSKDYKPPADTMKEISDACPGAVTLTSVTLSGDGAAIGGRASNDKDIAQFVVNLKTLPQYASVELVSVSEDTENAGSLQRRVFELNARLPMPVASPSPAPQATTDADTKGGEGK